MSALSSLAVSLSIAAAPLAFATAADVDDPAPLDIVETADAAGDFATLLAAVDAAGLVDALRADGPITVFAPNDAAFARLPEGTLEGLLRPEAREDLVAILTYHVVSGSVSAIDALGAGSADTLQGERLSFRLEDGALRVDGATVLANDLQARNGVIHVIDQVLLPPAREPLQPSAADLVLMAIDRGVPLFNDGQPAACAALYELACLSVLALGDAGLDGAGRTALARDLDRASSIHSASDRAWALRGALDATLAGLQSDARGVGSFGGAPSRSPGERTVPASEERVLFDFEEVRAEPWRAVNDDVMGGISRGAARVTDSGTAIFAGQLSLENNGGFATVRSQADDLGLTGWDGLAMRVRGDGRRYAVSAMKDDARRNVHIWQQEFVAPADEWIEIRVPFEDLAHRVMGWTIPNDPIDPAAIRALAFGISDKDTAPFALEIDWIRAYREG